MWLVIISGNSARLKDTDDGSGSDSEDGPNGNGLLGISQVTWAVWTSHDTWEVTGSQSKVKQVIFRDSYGCFSAITDVKNCHASVQRMSLLLMAPAYRWQRESRCRPAVWRRWWCRWLHRACRCPGLGRHPQPMASCSFPPTYPEGHMSTTYFLQERQKYSNSYCKQHNVLWNACTPRTQV